MVHQPGSSPSPAGRKTPESGRCRRARPQRCSRPSKPANAVCAIPSVRIRRLGRHKILQNVKFLTQNSLDFVDGSRRFCHSDKNLRWGFMAQKKEDEKVALVPTRMNEALPPDL